MMGKTVVILPPNVRAQEIVERSDFTPPREAGSHFEPLGMLIEHGIDDVDEGLIAIEHAVPPGEEIPLEPSFALMLAQHLHDTAGGGEPLVVRHGGGIPLAIGCTEECDDREKAVGVRWEIDAHDFRFLVYDVVDEPGVLVGETIVILTPDVRSEQVIE